MRLNITNEINEGIVKVTISVAELGNNLYDADTEREMLHNYNKTISFKDIEFKGNMKITDNIPILTSEEADSSTIVSVEIGNLINQEIPLDETFKVTYSIDSTKIRTSELDTVMSKPEMLAQARVNLFTEKIKASVTEKLTEIRALYSDFEGETEVVL